MDLKITHFFKVVCGCQVLEGFGSTETCGVSSVQLPGELRSGHVGPSLPCCMYKLGDVPELNLVANRDKKGEILVSGANVFKGYYKDEKKTQAVLDESGWFRTGDIGFFDECGCVKITDRIKNVYKLQHGEYIEPEKIENVYLKSNHVLQVFVYGDGLKNSLIAVIVPQETALISLATQMNLEPDIRALCNNVVIRQTILNDLNKLADDSELKPFEKVNIFNLKTIFIHIF